MEYRYALEPLRPIWDDVMRLAAAHWEEYRDIGVDGYDAPMNPDKKRYIHYNDIGYHLQFTVRTEAGELVGHAGMYVDESMHTRTKIATEDTWFLLKEHRKGSNALRFMRFVEDHLRSLGVKEIQMTAKLANKSGRIMEARGYKHVANEYLKVL